MKQKLEKWLRWIEIIQEDAEEILQSQHIFRSYVEIVTRNPKIQKPSDFHWWVRNNYVSYISMSVRKQIDSDPDVITIGKLLQELQNSPGALTRKWHRGLYTTLGSNIADESFDKIAGKGDCFDASIAKNDYSELEKISGNIIKYVDRRVAHKSKQPVPEVKFDEIDDFVTKFEKILRKYILLFTASGYAGLRPEFQYDWQKIFNYPWNQKKSK